MRKLLTLLLLVAAPLVTWAAPKTKLVLPATDAAAPKTVTLWPSFMAKLKCERSRAEERRSKELDEGKRLPEGGSDYRATGCVGGDCYTTTCNGDDCQTRDTYRASGGSYTAYLNGKRACSEAVELEPGTVVTAEALDVNECSETMARVKVAAGPAKGKVGCVVPAAVEALPTKGGK